MGLRMQSLPLDEGVLVATMNAISEGLWILQARRRQAAAAGGAGGSTMSCSRCFVIRHHSWRGRHATTDVGSLRKSLLLIPLIRNSSAYLIEIASSGFYTLLFVRPSSAYQSQAHHAIMHQSTHSKNWHMAMSDTPDLVSHSM